MPNNKKELAKMIARRDGISINEAYIAIDDCIEMIQEVIEKGRFEEAVDILREELGLEPDYFDILF